jgi:predicted DCC family thiol-disulfide oxidoreductase YuxK
MKHTVIYDGRCNLCSNLVQGLEQVDRGQQFDYIAMQEEAKLAQYGITPQDCELGMILIQQESPHQRWQGSNAAEEIARLLPLGAWLINAYRLLPGAKFVGDRVYDQVRDHRYDWFGKRSATYQSNHPAPEPACETGCDQAS